MSSDNQRLVAILGGGVVVAVVAVFLVTSLMKTKSSGSDKKAATSWAAHWQKTRQCLVGNKPYAASGALAIEMREAFTPFVDDVYKRCVLLLEEAKRPAGHSGKNQDMEQLWIDVELAVKKLETTVRVRLDGFARKHIHKIGSALDGVDAQYVRLAEAVGNPVPASRGQAKKLPVLKTQPLRWKGGRVHTSRRLRQVGTSLLAEMHELDKKRERLYIVNGPNRVDMQERSLDAERLGANVAPSGNRIVPGIWVKKIEELENDETKPGAGEPGAGEPAAKPAVKPSVDAGVTEADEPEPTHALVLKVGDKDHVITKTLEAPGPMFHLSEGETHIVGWKLGPAFFIAESVDGGKTWKQTYQREKTGWRVDRMSWSRVVVVTSGDGSAAYLVVDVKAAERTWTPKVISTDHSPADGGVLSCYADKATTWWLLRARDKATVVRDVAGSMKIISGGRGLSGISTCTADRMVGIGKPTGGEAPVVVCTDSKCKHAFNVRPDGAINVGAAMSAKGELIVATQHHRILSVWRAGKRSYHRLRTKAELSRLAVFGDQVYGVLRRGTKLRLVALTNVR